MDVTKPETSKLGHRLRELILGGGVEPDPRFTLANERTFLAWLRTALAVIGGGLALEALLRVGVFPGSLKFVPPMLFAIAAVSSLVAILRWVRVERAMRQKLPLPIPALIPVLATGVAIGALSAIALLNHG